MNVHEYNNQRNITQVRTTICELVMVSSASPVLVSALQPQEDQIEVIRMDFEAEQIYPTCSPVIRTVQVGGLSKSELLEALQQKAIAMNEAAERLFACDRFVTSAAQYAVTIVELTVRELGLPQGATTAEIYASAATLGLDLCPLELGPHLRLQYLDQPEGYWGKPIRQHQAPSGAITIASEQLSDDADVPKGFYLRRIKGTLWLRGYRSGPEHIWDGEDHFIFRRL